MIQKLICLPLPFMLRIRGWNYKPAYIMAWLSQINHSCAQSYLSVCVIFALVSLFTHIILCWCSSLVGLYSATTLTWLLSLCYYLVLPCKGLDAWWLQCDTKHNWWNALAPIFWWWSNTQNDLLPLWFFKTDVSCVQYKLSTCTRGTHYIQITF